MNCHACDAVMLEDSYGHPLHDGPCPGYPMPWTEDRVTCEHCGSEMVRKSLGEHQRFCSAARPKPVKVRNRRCPTCSLWHRPMCTAGPATWPLAPLLERVWSRLPERSLSAAADEIGIDNALLHRYSKSGNPTDVADRWACGIGYHPSLIWPEWFEAHLRPIDKLFVESGWRAGWLHDEPTPTPQGQEAAA